MRTVARFRAVARVLSVAAGALLIVSGAQAQTASPENLLYLDLKDGRVEIVLRPDKAPQHVERIKRLVREGFYDGLKFHRVIDGFMAQTGDPLGNGTGQSDYPDLPAEFNSLKHLRGTVSMARAQNPDSANSQFFIMFGPAPSLDGQYTAWGQVIRGMEFVDNIKRGSNARNGSVDNPDRIVRMRVQADL